MSKKIPLLTNEPSLVLSWAITSVNVCYDLYLDVTPELDVLIGRAFQGDCIMVFKVYLLLVKYSLVRTGGSLKLGLERFMSLPGLSLDLSLHHICHAVSSSLPRPSAMLSCFGVNQYGLEHDSK